MSYIELELEAKAIEELIELLSLLPNKSSGRRAANAARRLRQRRRRILDRTMEQPVTYHIEYELDEFQPWPGLAIYAYGVATVTYKWEGRDRDTGDDAGPHDIELEHLTISADKAKEPDRCIEQTDPLFRQVEAILCASRDVYAACKEDYEQD